MAILASLLDDWRSAIRQFRTRPAITATMIVVLAVGLALSTTVFIVITSFTSGPLAGVTPTNDSVRIRGIDRSRGPGRAQGREFSNEEFAAFAAATPTFRSVAAWTSVDATLDVGSDAPNLISGAATFVTVGYFDILGAHTAPGGFPSTVDPGAPTIGVISEALWDRYYDRATDIVGRRLTVNATTVTIVGVAPRRFVGARSGGSSLRVWIPMDHRGAVLPSVGGQPPGAALGIIARLQPGVSPAAASTVASTIASRVSEGAVTQPDADVVPIQASNYFPPSGEPSTGIGRYVSVLMPLLVLLISGTSVSALLAGLAISRQREMGVRLAMGAGRGRIVRQLLTETAVVAVLAGGLALLVLWWFIEGLDASLDAVPLTIGWTTAAFVAILAAFTSITFGLSPALHATRLAVAEVLQESMPSRRRTRLQAMLVVAQIAFTQPALLAMGGLLLELRREGSQMAAADPVADHILEVAFNTNPRYGVMNQAREDGIARAQARISALPGVTAVTRRDMWGAVATATVEAASVEAEVEFATSDLLTVRGWTLTQGRVPGAADREEAGAALINRGLARALWGNDAVVGRQFTAQSDLRRGSGTLTVVGVVDDELSPRYYVPESRLTTSHLLVRSMTPASAMVPAVRAAAVDAAPEHPVTAARPLSARDADARRSLRRGMVLAGLTGIAALFLSAIGLYAVVSVAASQRKQEVGIRVALGATPRQIQALFFSRGVGLAARGLLMGLFGSVLVMQLLGDLTNGAPPEGLGLLSAGVSVLVLLVAVIATWLPSRRASHVDPLSVLRTD